MTDLESPIQKALIGGRRFFTKVQVSEDDRAVFKKGGREGDSFYRDRWAHDKVVRSTHGVNCTGSCSWKVYVKDPGALSVRPRGAAGHVSRGQAALR